MILNGHADPDTNSTAKPRSKPMLVEVKCFPLLEKKEGS